MSSNRSVISASCWSCRLCNSALQSATSTYMPVLLSTVFLVYLQEGCKLLRWVCLSVCLSNQVPETTWLNFKIFVHVDYGRGSLILRSIVICHVSPVLWMMSRFPTMCPLCVSCVLLSGKASVTAAKTTVSIPNKFCSMKRSGTHRGLCTGGQSLLLQLAFSDHARQKVYDT